MGDDVIAAKPDNLFLDVVDWGHVSKAEVKGPEMNIDVSGIKP
jgi:hypothetical protein